MPWYRIGTIAVTNNSPIVTGTAWADATAVSDELARPWRQRL